MICYRQKPHQKLIAERNKIYYDRDAPADNIVGNRENNQKTYLRETVGGICGTIMV